MKKFMFIISFMFFMNINTQFFNDLQMNEKELIASILDNEDELSKDIIRNAADETLVISIGGACLAALQIFKAGLRKAAYPFDVIFSDLQGVMKAIETDFSFFLDTKYLTRKFFKNTYHLYNSIYNFIFPHDMTSKVDTELNINKEPEKFINFKEKYKRRIDRFNSLNKFAGKVFFLRTHTSYTEPDTIENLISLKKVITKKFPNLKFEIIVVKHITHSVEEQKIDNIKFFYVKDLGLSSKLAEQEFLNVFNLLSIKTLQIKPLNFFVIAER